MKLRKFIRLILKENLGSSQQQRFDTAIYLTYVEQHRDNEFKHVSWEEFFSKLNYDNVYSKKIVRFDKDRIYRLADEKEIWLGERNDVLGEVWIEEDEGGTGDIESYWIKKKFYKN